MKKTFLKHVFLAFIVVSFLFSFVVSQQEEEEEGENVNQEETFDREEEDLTTFQLMRQRLEKLRQDLQNKRKEKYNLSQLRQKLAEEKEIFNKNNNNFDLENLSESEINLAKDKKAKKVKKSKKNKKASEQEKAQVNNQVEEVLDQYFKYGNDDKPSSAQKPSHSSTEKPPPPPSHSSTHKPPPPSPPPSHSSTHRVPSHSSSESKPRPTHSRTALPTHTRSSQGKNKDSGINLNQDGKLHGQAQGPAKAEPDNHGYYEVYFYDYSKAKPIVLKGPNRK